MINLDENRNDFDKQLDNAHPMDTMVRGVSSCRHCQFYKMEGRRGGHCSQLGVLVQGRWRACAFATPLFAAPTAIPLPEGATSADRVGIVPLQEVLERETATPFSEGRIDRAAIPADPLLLQETAEAIATQLPDAVVRILPASLPSGPSSNLPPTTLSA